jgi:hypothetical protein
LRRPLENAIARGASFFELSMHTVDGSGGEVEQSVPNDETKEG